jgi:AraC-like DNA-binding protein
MHAPVQHHDAEFHAHTLVCEGPLARQCKALMAVDVVPGPRQPLVVVPHGSVLLSLQFASGGDPFARAGDRGLLPHVCTWREASHRYTAIGGCRSFFALLTPEGAMALSRGQSLPAQAHPRRPLATWMDREPLVALEDALAREPHAAAQLRHLGAWLENRLLPHQHLPPPAVRAARIAAGMLAAPVSNIARLAASEGQSRRQLERDFRRCFGISPKQASLVARVQAAARLGFRGLAPAEIAQQLGFADQPHLNRTVKQMFGVSPPVLARTAHNAMSAAFRFATGGGLVYL